MNDLFSLPLAFGAARPTGGPAPAHQAPPGKEPEIGSSGDPPFADVLEKARKRNPEEADLAVLAQMLPPAMLVFTPEQAVSGTLPTLENGEVVPVQAAASQAVPVLPGEPVLTQLTQVSEAMAEATANPQQAVPASELPVTAEAPAAGSQQTAVSDLQPETGNPQTAAGDQPPGANSQKQAAQSQTKATAEPSETLDASQPAIHAQKPEVQDRFSMDEPSAASKSDGTGKAAVELGYNPVQTQMVENSNVEPARLAEARQPQFLDQISKNLQNLEKSGQSTLRLQLHPENLGKIDLRLTNGVEGLRVTLTADLTATGSLLERHLPELRQALSEAGVNLAGLSIDYGNTQGGSPQQERWQSAQQPMPRSSVPLHEDEPADFTPRRKNLSLNNSNVDYLV